MEVIAKKQSKAFGKKVYLLGVDKDGIYYWLEEPEWDCGWYWGMGYVETYTNNKNPSISKDIDSHQHFDGLFFNKKKNGFDNFNDFFVKSVLTENELWKLIELMKTAYTLSETAEVLGCGGSNYTTNICKDIIVNTSEVERINKVVLPEIFKQIELLLTYNSK